MIEAFKHKYAVCWYIFLREQRKLLRKRRVVRTEDVQDSQKNHLCK
jgi:hypothetical protein